MNPENPVLLVEDEQAVIDNLLLGLLATHHFPGNVWELRSIVYETARRHCHPCRLT